MWFGTHNGLSRFDGYTFKNYGPTQRLKNNMVILLQEDPAGRIWMSTLSQNLYYHQQDSIYPYKYNHIIQNQIRAHKKFRALGGYFYRENDGTLYAELPSIGILKIQANGSFQLYQSRTPRGLIVLDLNQLILSAYTDLPFEEREVLRKKGVHPAMELYRDSVPLIVQGFQHDAQPNNILVKRIGQRRYLAGRPGAHYLIEEDRILWRRECEIGQEGVPKSFLIDKEGRIFMGIYSTGELRKYKDLNAFKNQDFIILLKTPYITSLFFDSEGGMWVGAAEEGVFYRPDNTIGIYDRSSGLPANNISALALINEDSIFAASNSNEIFLINRKSSHIQALPKMYPDRKDYVSDLIYDQNRVALIASTGFVSIFQNDAWMKIPILYPSGRRHFLTGKRMTVDKDQSSLWASGISIFFKKDLDKLSDPDLFERFILPERPYVVFEDLQKRVWVGTIGGLYELRDDTIVRPESMPPEFSLRIEDIDQLSDSTLVFGSKGAGVVLWKGSDFFSIRQADGLSANMIENVHVDDRDNIWVGTLAGLNKIKWKGPDSFFVKQFTMEHGLPSNEINRVKTWGEHVWAATTRGLVHFVDDGTINTKTTPPILEKILVNNLPIDPKAKSIFSSTENNLIIHYLSIDYTQNGRILYRYRLKPGAASWTATNLRSVNFSAMKAGTYTFEVQSQNEDGFWSASTLYRFRIRPPFWQTWPFIGLLAILIGVSAYRFYKYRTNQLRQEALTAKQITELERAALRAQMNPHFIFNCLSSISSFFNQGDKVSGNHYLSLFAQLIRAVLHHSMTESVSLEDELQLLENYIKMEQMRFEDGFDYEVRLGDNVSPFEIEIPPMLLQPYIENAIIHGLAKKEGKGKIGLQFELEPGRLKVSVTDNGIGISQSKKLNGADGSTHKSVGMTITQKRLAMSSANGRRGQVTTEELKNKEGKVAGTKVEVWIPVANNVF